MAKINQEEYELLRGLDAEWKWIARDSGGLGNEKLFLYLEKPYKDHNTKVWSTDDNTASHVSDQLFQFIQWENEKPYRINELIGEYGSEEEEIKNKAELKAWFEDDKLYMGGYVKHKINQLDEPETLSPEWIDDHAYAVAYDGMPDETEVVYVDDLKEIPVPKQEITEEQAYNKIAETLPATAKEIELVLEKYYSGVLTGSSEELRGCEPETVADVVTTFWESYERLKEVMSIEVKELE